MFTWCLVGCPLWNPFWRQQRWTVTPATESSSLENQHQALSSMWSLQEYWRTLLKSPTSLQMAWTLVCMLLSTTSVRWGKTVHQSTVYFNKNNLYLLRTSPPFLQDTLEMCSREQEFNSMLFSLCFFHACVTERRKFGPQGWNHIYPFSTGDLTISANVLYNYLEANAKVFLVLPF